MYEFKESDAYDFARHVGISIHKSGHNLTFARCPYCQGATNDKNTFAIDLGTGRFQCLRASCGAKGNMITLAKDFNFDIGLATEYYAPKKPYKKLPNKKPSPKPKAIEYMLSRGISEKTTQKYRITTQDKNTDVLVFPFYDENNVLQIVKYRNMAYQKGSKGSKEWCEKGCKPILFGMNECSTEKSDTLVITEGQIDSLSVAESGIPNAVSVPTGAKGFTWLPYCWDFCKQFKTIVVFGDYEKGKITLLDELKARFDSVKHIREKDYKGCKDANELLQKYGSGAVRKAIENAVFTENKHIKPLVSVERKSYAEIENFKSRLSTLNKMIGGFYMGTLTIITGERGLGKSTFASQLGLDAIRSGYTCFFYSGELNDWQFQNWMEVNMFGPENLNRHSRDGYVYWTTKAEYQPLVNNWYKDKAYLYDNSMVDNEAESLMETIEIAIKQYACRVIFIDNLMTAISDDLTSDLYRQQSNFTRKLKSIAIRFDVCIFLVAHPRKRTTDKWSNDDVSGSGNITNLADISLAYTLTKENEKGDRKICVTKNRINGRMDIEGFPVYFEESSKRISDTQDFNWEYGWETSETGFNDISDEETPFY